MNRVRARRGITLIEVTTVSGLMTVLAMLIASTWVGMGRPTVDVITRGALFQELDMAAATLAQDLGGSMSGPDARLGGKTKYSWVGWMSPAAGELWLCYDGGTNPNGEADWGGEDTVIIYSTDSNTLTRRNQNLDETFTIAKYVTDFSISEVGVDFLSIALTFEHNNTTRTCTLLVRKPVN